MKAVTQEEPMGCAVACVAAVLNTSYRDAKKLFDKPENAKWKGYYCREIVNSLNKVGGRWCFGKYDKKMKSLLSKEGTIVFIGRGSRYPEGHFLARAKKGWMNSWINSPTIAPAKSGFEGKLLGRVEWVMFRETDS